LQKKDHELFCQKHRHHLDQFVGVEVPKHEQISHERENVRTPKNPNLVKIVVNLFEPQIEVTLEKIVHVQQKHHPNQNLLKIKKKLFNSDLFPQLFPAQTLLVEKIG
jgi:hypothetical protein